MYFSQYKLCARACVGIVVCAACTASRGHQQDHNRGAKRVSSRPSSTQGGDPPESRPAQSMDEPTLAGSPTTSNLRGANASATKGKVYVEPAHETVQMIARAAVLRDSPSGKPPWVTAQIISAPFGVAVEKGKSVSLLPVDSTAPPVTATIRAVTIRDEFVDEGIAPWWAVDIGPIVHPAYVSAGDVNAPALAFKVVVVYPAMTDAKRIDPKGWVAELSPPTSIEAIKAAVDVNHDGRPDIVERSVCTQNPRRPSCGEATAHEILRREGQTWARLYRFEPAT